jgi:hypothetical protein
MCPEGDHEFSSALISGSSSARFSRLARVQACRRDMNIKQIVLD